MKKRMKSKKEQGKISWFLRSMKTKNSGFSFIRRQKRGNTNYPNSSKIGAGKEISLIRNIPMGKFKHRKNHRTNETIGVVFPEGNKVN